MHKPTLNKPQKEHCKVIRRNWVHFYKVFHIFWSYLLLQKKGQLHNRNLPIYSKLVQQSLMMLHTWSLFPAFRDSIVWRTFEPCTREWLEMRLSSRYPYPQTVASLQVSQGQRKSLLKQFCKYLLWQIQTGMKPNQGHSLQKCPRMVKNIPKISGSYLTRKLTLLTREADYFKSVRVEGSHI